MYKTKLVYPALTVALLLTAGCANGKQTQTDVAATGGKPAIDLKTPVTLKVAYSASEESFKQFTQNPVIKQKFPNVTFQYVKYADLDKAIAAGDTPDLVSAIISAFAALDDYGLQYDVGPLAKQLGVDMSKFEQKKLEVIRSYGAKGELYGLPDNLEETSPYNTYALIYNKDIFDKFAVPYPQDNMTWDQTVDLARKFVRTDGGTEYKGLVAHAAPHFLAFQLGLEFVGPNGKVSTADPKWSELLRINGRISGEQGGFLPKGGDISNFYKTKNVAMYAGDAGDLFRAPDKYESIQWDAATYPVFAGMAPHTVVGPNGGMWTITATSKHKELAMAVLDTILSPEVMKSIPNYDWWNHPLVKTKRLDVLKNPNYPTVKTNDYMQKYNLKFRAEIANATESVSKNGVDINTALRTFQDKFQAVIDADGNK
ncbi:ABC transporter substrate-binding protein [Paenibacillus sp. GYB003]|uniref:ABC transporter substrate-binding protein n=1 Tax=Paenibacillus sp. GYB003 TaxID=2994392 RepID=UPI002F964E12